MSINKAQGQTMKKVGIDLRTPVFSHGQLYVAFSRATDSSDVCVLLPPDSDSKAVNVVYPEVLHQ
jgi:ATP-dependent exoDNAse (exonuclease V) alpha subunit